MGDNNLTLNPFKMGLLSIQVGENKGKYRIRKQGYSIKQINDYLSTGDNRLKPARPPKDPVILELQVIKEQLKRREEFNHAPMTHLEKQQEYIQNSLKKRDQQLIDVVRESQ